MNRQTPGFAAVAAALGLAFFQPVNGGDSNSDRSADLRAAAGSKRSAAPLVERVHQHVSSEPGVLANAYLIETSEGVVAVDAPLTVSDAKAFRERLDSLRRPLLAVLLTHGHPDHYNGLTQLVAGTSVPIVATPGVAAVIREWDERKADQWKPIFKEEWPARRTFPNRSIAGGGSVVFGGVRFTVHDLGPGESHHDAYWVAEEGGVRVAFIGDLAFHGEHAYVSDGHTGAWLKSIDRTRGDLAGVARVFPGHGAPGGPEMLDQQRRYLEHYRAAVRRLAAGRASMTEGEKAQLTEILSAFLPAGRLIFLVAHGADAVAAELARQSPKSARP